MKLNWILLAAGGLGSVLFGQQYPQQYSPYQGNPSYNGQYDNGQYDNGQNVGQYPADPSYGAAPSNVDPAYSGGVYAPPPPAVPSYAYQQPPAPGPGYVWVGGYWNFVNGQYLWVGGYWTLPPYQGEYWIAPHYVGGRFFLGYWGGSRGGFTRGFVGNDDRRRVEPQRQAFSAPRGGNGFRSDNQRNFANGFTRNDHAGQERVQAPRQGSPARQSQSGFRSGENRSGSGNGQRGHR